MNQKMSFDEQEQLSRSLIAVNPHRNGNKGTITTMLLDDYKELTQKFFSLQAVADGAVSRLCLSTIIRPDFAPRPVVGEYDEQFRSALRPYIDYLNGAHGMVDCKKARLLAERLEAQIMETAQLADNKPYAELAKRVLANGYRKALVLYLANGEKWEGDRGLCGVEREVRPLVQDAFLRSADAGGDR